MIQPDGGLRALEVFLAALFKEWVVPKPKFKEWLVLVLAFKLLE